MYCFCLLSHCIVIVLLQVDLDGQETLSFEEFVDLTTILLGNIASRAVVQLLLSLVVVPMLATILMSVLCFLHPPHYIWSYVVPAGVPTTILSSLLLMFTLPTLIEHVDAYFLKRASVVNEGKKKS